MGALGIQKCRSLCCWDCPPGHLTTPTDSTLSLFAESELLAPNETMDITVPTNCDKYFAKTSVSSAQESCLKTKFRPLFAQWVTDTPLCPKGLPNAARSLAYLNVFEFACLFLYVPVASDGHTGELLDKVDDLTVADVSIRNGRRASQPRHTNICILAAATVLSCVQQKSSSYHKKRRSMPVEVALQPGTVWSPTSPRSLDVESGFVSMPSSGQNSPTSPLNLGIPMSRRGRRASLVRHCWRGVLLLSTDLLSLFEVWHWVRKNWNLWETGKAGRGNLCYSV